MISEIAYCYNNKMTRLGVYDSEKNLFQKVNAEKVTVPNIKVQEYFKYKDKGEITGEYRKFVLSSWKKDTSDYDFILSYCVLFTPHGFDTIKERIYVPGREKSSSRWGVGKRVHSSLQKGMDRGAK